jgi:hypothetical protein
VLGFYSEAPRDDVHGESVAPNFILRVTGIRFLARFNPRF